MNPSPQRPIITLTTDFGTTDHYVGTMKGVILRHCPDAQIIDVTHEVQPFSTYTGAYAIEQAAPYFPEGTAHVVVVDPGVGTARKPLVITTRNQYFIAPDNGVLSLITGPGTAFKAFEILRPDLVHPDISKTFHGRDLFAPTAAALASQRLRPEDVGPELDGITQIADMWPKRIRPDWWHGKILCIDRFGNIVTNFKVADFPNVQQQAFRLEIGNHQMISRYHDTFGEAPAGQPFVYSGSSGYLEAGINQGDAARELGASVGQSISLRL
ncbi:MAG: SAM-dependent chlorinase/fluorinase [Acidobacteriaceae bacterium]|nr:SAM-dependent chlorinase/fluorinase [Acidobacteriaceae bacterium]